MKAKLTEHFLGIAVVTLLMLGTLFLIENRARLDRRDQQAKISHLINVPVDKINDPFERALLADCLDLFYPGRHDTNMVLLNDYFHFREAQFNKTLQSSMRSKRLSVATIIDISLMYLKFVLIYIIVMLLTYYGVQTLGTLRFIRKQQALKKAVFAESGRRTIPGLLSLAKGTAKTFAYFILFSPAYVIAYSIRTEFKTDSSFFMILLGVLSNGLLVMYMNKFYAFLVAESRKGYVENALVKNLSSDYTISGTGAISWKSLLKIRKKFTGHVFDHIFNNARFQYLATIKEQASFLITGLVIIEMALNIHGHLAYEMLRQLLYKNYALVIIIMLLIFYTVKITEIITDLMVNRELKRYENN